MKKIIPIIFLFFCVYGLINKEETLIPDYAIRFRVIANSNTLEDQRMKYQLKNELENELNSLMVQAKSKEEATTLIQENMKWIRDQVSSYSKENNVSFGKNYFPEKEYKGVTYPSGEYDSLVITLGKGEGENWWCVMFPPLCLLDSKENIEDIDYKLFIQEVLKKYE